MQHQGGAVADGAVGGLVDDLFRREAGRLVARLTRFFGTAQLDLAEEAVQEALMRALHEWPFSGIPDRPDQWLYRTARNAALDRLRRQGTAKRLSRDVVMLAEARLQDSSGHVFAREIDDDQLRLMFICCHPDLPPEARVALTLKTVGGFGVGEIARAFLAEETAVAQRLVRAKRRIAELALPFAMPEPDALPARLQSVIDVIYLLFNEGYAPGEGDTVIRADLCGEAVRLARLLAAHPVTGTPEVSALTALLCFQAARMPARGDGAGDILRLAEQDRSLWDRALIGVGLAHLDRAARGDALTALHLEAGIASCHAAAATFEQTDWKAIVGYYDLLLERAANPVVALNRAMALSMAEGPSAGLRALEVIAVAPSLRRYYLLPAARGDLLERMDRPGEAIAAFTESLALAGTGPVRRFIEARIESLRARLPQAASGG